MQVFQQVFSEKSQVFCEKGAPKADAPDGCFPSFKTSRVANKVSTEEAQLPSEDYDDWYDSPAQLLFYCHIVMQLVCGAVLYHFIKTEQRSLVRIERTRLHLDFRYVRAVIVVLDFTIAAFHCCPLELPTKLCGKKPHLWLVMSHITFSFYLVPLVSVAPPSRTGAHSLSRSLAGHSSPFCP